MRGRLSEAGHLAGSFGHGSQNGRLSGAGQLTGSFGHGSQNGRLSGAGQLTGSLGRGSQNGRLTVPQRIGTPYTGEYEFTPSAETQTIPTSNKALAQDITINPIPSNYGLITWDGSTLTVS